MRQAPFMLSGGAFLGAVIVVVALVTIGVGATLVAAHTTATWSTVIGAGDVAPSRPWPRVILGVYQTPIARDETTANERRRDLQRLSTYGWVDRSRGVVRIPIERAMELVAKEGM